MPDLLLPVSGFTGVSTWQDHIDRGTPSSEPGTDFYVPAGTRVIAPADGEIWGWGDSVEPPTGRWVGINFANGMSFRCLHHREVLKRSGRVFAGDDIAISGASGYGSEYFGEPYRNANFWNETGGDHTHATLWLDWNHRYGYRDAAKRNPYTVDLMDYVAGGSGAGGTFNPFEEDDMFSDADRALLQDVQNKLSMTGADYGRPEVIQQRVDKIITKLETGAGYDWLPAIANQGHAILAVLGKLETGGLEQVEVDALADALREGLGDEVAGAVVERLASKLAQP